MLWRWIFTVPSLMASRLAISLVRRPLAAMRTISSSRGVRPGFGPCIVASRRSKVSSARPESCFSSHCSPACTLRTHCTNSCGASSFNTMPRTPSRKASRTSSSSIVAASRTTRVGSICWCSALSTSSPFLRGMWMSRIRMSGRCCCTAARASSPFTQRATTSKSPSNWNRLCRPSSTIGWSSATTRRIVMLGALRGGREPDLQASAGGGRADGQLASQRVDALLQHDGAKLEPGESLMVVEPVEREAAPVVGNRDPHVAALCLHGHTNLGSAGVSSGVDERLLHDVADVVGQGIGRSVRLRELQLYLQAPHALEPLDQLPQACIEGRVSRCGAEGVERLVADEEAQIALLFHDEPLDLRESFPGRLGLRLEEALRALELQSRAGKRLQHAVVQVAGEALALLRGRSLPHLARQQKMVQGLGDLARDNLAQAEVVGARPALVEEQQASPHALAAHGH